MPTVKQFQKGGKQEKPLDTGHYNTTTGKVVVWGTPEYEKAYHRGEVVTDKGVKSPVTIQGGTLPEVVIQNNYKRGFWEKYKDKIVEENKDAGVLGAIVGTPISAVASLPQLAMMEGLTGKVQRPSEAIGFENNQGLFESPTSFGKHASNFVLDAVTDPANLIGAGVLTKEKVLAGLARSTEDGLLSNAYKYNPWAFKSQTGKIYRQVGKPGFDNYLTQEQAVQARAERMIAQQADGKKPWVGQNNEELTTKFKNAVDNHNPSSDYSADKLGRNTTTSTEISKAANLSDANKARVAAHEVGHYYMNSADEGVEWLKSFDFSNHSQKIKRYFTGEGKRGRDWHGIEVRERAAQLKDYIAQKNGIPANKDFTVTKSQLDDAITNYTADTGLDNNMSQMLSSLKDKNSFLKNINKYALGVAPIAGASYLATQAPPQEQPQYKNGGKHTNSEQNFLKDYFTAQTFEKGGQKTDKERQAYAFFISKGWKPEQAIGIVGNLKHESNFDTTVLGTADDKGSRAIAQWHGDRLKMLKSKYGENWTDFKNQLEFVDWELRNTHKTAGDKLRNSKGVWEAGRIVSDDYEIPKVKFNADERRQRNVADLAMKFKGIKLTPEDNLNYGVTFENSVAPYMNAPKIKETPFTTIQIPEMQTPQLSYLDTPQETPNLAAEEEQKQSKINPQEEAFMQDLLSQMAEGVGYVEPQKSAVFQDGGQIPISSEGMYAYPNQPVIVPTNGAITMKNIPHPILGISKESGERKIMKPENEYFFNNTKTVTEIPLTKAEENFLKDIYETRKK